MLWYIVETFFYNNFTIELKYHLLFEVYFCRLKLFNKYFTKNIHIQHVVAIHRIIHPLSTGNEAVNCSSKSSTN